MWIQTGVTVRKRLSWVVISVTLTFDLWPWPFAWTSLLTMVITPENFMMIRWWEHGEKGVTDRQTDGQTDRRTDGRTENTICRAAWSQLKNVFEPSPGDQSRLGIRLPEAFPFSLQPDFLFMLTSRNLPLVLFFTYELYLLATFLLAHEPLTALTFT